MTTAARPVFGRPETGRPADLVVHRADLPIMQLCRDPRVTAPTGDPCYRCLAQRPGPDLCHFTRKDAGR
jgi:hypothetical protein